MGVCHSRCRLFRAKSVHGQVSARNYWKCETTNRFGIFKKSSKWYRNFVVKNCFTSGVRNDLACVSYMFVERGAQTERASLSKTIWFCAGNLLHIYVLKVIMTSVLTVLQNVTADAIPRNEEFKSFTLNQRKDHYFANINYSKMRSLQIQKRDSALLWRGDHFCVLSYSHFYILPGKYGTRTVVNWQKRAINILSLIICIAAAFSFSVYNYSQEGCLSKLCWQQ